MNAAPHQRELVASHIRYVSLQPQVNFQGSLLILLASIWSPYVVPSLVPVSPCFVATRLIPPVLDPELAFRSDDLISSTRRGSPQPARMAIGSTGEIIGMPTMRRSIKFTHIPIFPLRSIHDT
jgi:hypothetical protein